MKNITLILFAASLFSACAPAYVPTMVHTPLFKEKGDFSGSVNTGVNNIEGHIAGAITNNFGLIVSGSTSNWEDKDQQLYRKNSTIEFAPGLYKNFGNGFVLESFAGIGFGHINSKGGWKFENDSVVQDLSRTVKGNFTKYFIQPGLGFQSRFADIAFHTRITGVNFHNLKNENGDVVFNGFNSFIEPVITVRAGFEYIKFSLQTGISAPLNKLNHDYNPFICNFGIFIDLRKGYRQKDKNSGQ